MSIESEMLTGSNTAWAQPTLSLIDCYDTVDFHLAPFCGPEYTPTQDSSDSPTIAECFRVCIKANDHASRRETIGKVQRLFARAVHRYINGYGPRVYLQYQTHEGEPCYRAEILATSKNPSTARAGHFEVDDSSLRWLWGEQVLNVQVCFLRQRDWELCEEIEIPLTNIHGTEVVGGLQIDQYTDLTPKNNFVDIEALAIESDSCVPIRIEMGLQGTAGQSPIDEILIGATNFADAELIRHIYEGEGRARGPGTVIADANASNGEYIRVGWDGLERCLLEWDLTSTTLDAMMGGWVRVIAVYSEQCTPTTDNELYAQIDGNDGRVLWRGARVRQKGNKQDLGVVQLPPNRSQNGSSGCDTSIRTAPMRLCLMAQKSCSSQDPAGSATTICIDYIELQPVEGWRKLKIYDGFPLDVSSTIHDGMGNEVYEVGPSGKNNSLVGSGDICLHPDVAHRLYFNFGDPLGLNVRAFYRPRRAVI